MRTCLLRRLLCITIAMAGGLHGTATVANTYPTKPVRIIVPYVAGGGADIIGRHLAKGLSTALGQPVIVENKAGAGGMIGTVAGVTSPPDGYTLTLISSSYTVNPSLYKLNFDPVKDITPIVQVSQGPLLVVVNPKVPAKSLAELVSLAKSKPGQLNYASSGQGSILHLGAALFADTAGIEMNHIPYKGGGAALTDLVAHQVDVYFAATASALPIVKSGKLRPLAVTSAKRIPALPNVPTIAESGFAGYDVTLWYGLIGPKGLPPDIVNRINSEVNKMLAQSDFQAKLEVDGALPAGGTPSQFQATLVKEIPVWRKIVTKLGVKAE